MSNSHSPKAQIQDFILLQLSLPADAREVLRLHYQVYLTDALYSKTSAPISESTFIDTNLHSILARFSNPNLLAAKLVPSATPEILAAYIVWNPPASTLDVRTQEELDRDLRREADELGEGSDREVFYKLRVEDEALNKKFFGEGFETKFWVLDALVVDENFQRKGLGT
ncbi:hypothetical protein LSUE1_G007062, partial [Lachnellula suecica]